MMKRLLQTPYQTLQPTPTRKQKAGKDPLDCHDNAQNYVNLESKKQTADAMSENQPMTLLSARYSNARSAPMNHYLFPIVLAAAFVAVYWIFCRWHSQGGGKLTKA